METAVVCRGYIGITEKKMETTIVCRGYIGIMEKKMETTIVCRGHIRIMEKKMETTIVYWDCTRLLAYVGLRDISPILEKSIGKDFQWHPRGGLSFYNAHILLTLAPTTSPDGPTSSCAPPCRL